VTAGSFGDEDALEPETRKHVRAIALGEGIKTVAVELGRMTVIALLSVAPATEGDMREDVADAVSALEDFDVAYETNPMGTVIEAETVDELFAAAKAAHEAVDADRVSTFLKIDDKRTSSESAGSKVDAVEEALGHEARSDRE
jgi:uncharacterized protein (TIGR00106 family)